MALRLHSVVRDLFRTPAFTTLAVGTLALGIGATTAMFSVVDAVLLRPLPYPAVARFAQLWTARHGNTQPGVIGDAVPELRRQLADIAEVEGYQMGSATLTGGAEPDIVGAPAISPRMLTLVGATPSLGRLFTDDDFETTPPPIIISHQLWTTNFGGAADVIGREIELDETRHRIIGVMSPRVRFPEANAAVWRLLNMAPAKPSSRRIMAIAVRRPTVTRDQFAARLNNASMTLVETKLLSEGQSLFGDVLMQERFGRSNARAYWLMFGAVLLVMLVACVNVSNLLLARASDRQGEFALRSALGAARGRLMLAALGECLLIAAAAGLTGVAIARALLNVLLAILPPQLTFLAGNASGIDARVLLFAVSISLLACLLAGLLPLVRVSSTNPMDAIQRYVFRFTRRDDFWQAALIAGQLSLVAILLCGAGLLLRSFVRLSNVDTGIDPRNVVIVQASLTSRRYMSAGATRQFLLALEERLEATGMMHVTYSGDTPVVASSVYTNVKPEAENGADLDLTGQVLPYIEVAPDYFATLGIPLIAGRTFAADDPEDVIVVNDRLARAYWGVRSPVGQRFRPSRDQPWTTVIGVVGDVRQQLTDPISHGMEIYRQEPRNRAGGVYAILARVNGNPQAAISAIKQALWSQDSRIPVLEAMPLTERFAESLYYQRFFLRLSVSFTLIATTLAVVGVYGAFSYWLARRKRELAIRMAIGASPQSLMASVLVRGFRLAVIGAGLGLSIALAGARVMKTMLFEIDPRDPATLGLTTVLLAGAAMAACVIPAMRAARIDPITTLRAE